MWGPIQGKMFKLKAEELGRHPWFAHEENENLALEANALLLFHTPGRSVPRVHHRTLVSKETRAVYAPPWCVCGTPSAGPGNRAMSKTFRHRGEAGRIRNCVEKKRQRTVQKARLPGAASSESLRRKKGELCTVEEGPESASNVPPRCQGHRQEASIRQVLAASRRNRREALCLTSAPEGSPQDCAFTSKPAPPAWEYPGGSCVSDPEVDDKMNKLAEYYFDSS